MKNFILTLILAMGVQVNAKSQSRALMVLSDYQTIETLGHSVVPTQYDQGHLNQIEAFFNEVAIKLDVFMNSDLVAVDSRLYDIIVIPDSALVLEDLVRSNELGRILKEFAAEQKSIVTIGHGSAALLSAIDGHDRFLRVMVETKMEKLNYHFPREEMPQLVYEQKKLAKNWVFANKNLTGFSKIEDMNEESRGRLMFYTEEALDRAGAKFDSKFGPVRFTVKDGSLITTQNSQTTLEALRLAIQ